jgi:Domain of unknown function (DUF5615)
VKFLVAECLSPKLVKLAQGKGYGESTHVVWRKLAGKKDWELKSFILDGDWTFVTRNSVDFRGPSSIERQRFAGAFIYFAMDQERRQGQVSARGKIAQIPVGAVSAEVIEHEVKAAIILFFSLLDERQRRLFAGLEALKIGRGADARVAALLGVDPHTVAKGRIELLGEDIDPTRVRKPGGGRRAAEKKLHDPGKDRGDPHR